jgi:hypothetical protein
MSARTKVFAAVQTKATITSGGRAHLATDAASRTREGGASSEQASLDRVHARREALVQATRGTGASLYALECGYYDPGARVATDNQALHGACIAHHEVISPSGTRSMVMLDSIPSGAALATDQNWPELQALRTLKQQ